MNILLIFPGFILALIIVFCYECKIRNLSTKLKNKVHFYVTCEVNYHHGGIIRTLWLGKPIYTEDKRFVPDKCSNILDVVPSVSYKLNYSDFYDMKEGEIREVFLNTED